MLWNSAISSSGFQHLKAFHTHGTKKVTTQLLRNTDSKALVFEGFFKQIILFFFFILPFRYYYQLLGKLMFTFSMKRPFLTQINKKSFLSIITYYTSYNSPLVRVSQFEVEVENCRKMKTHDWSTPGAQHSKLIGK